jgi:hypothetical protein
MRRTLATTLLCLSFSVANAAIAADTACGTLESAAAASATDTASGAFALKEGEPVDLVRESRRVHGALHVYRDDAVYRVYWQPQGSAELYVLATAGENRTACASLRRRRADRRSRKAPECCRVSRCCPVRRFERPGLRPLRRAVAGRATRRRLRTCARSRRAARRSRTVARFVVGCRIGVTGRRLLLRAVQRLRLQ